MHLNLAILVDSFLKKNTADAGEGDVMAVENELKNPIRKTGVWGTHRRTESGGEAPHSKGE